ncbi:MAG: LytTR family DNA-binding domain-containing protein [Bacteroidota bacterium]|nr:LytTR family DNA-binding domain-containing protein [Bacteroidota bacterium]
MRTLIIDNEEKIREGLIKQIKALCPSITDINEATGVQSGVKAILEYKPDLVFLDVEMDDGTGIELIKKLGNFNFQLIFITAHDKYAINAFKLSAIDFLLKPIDAEDLIVAVGKAEQNLKNKTLDLQFQILQESLSSITIHEKKIVLKDSESIYFVKVSDIVHCKAEGPYTEFYLIPQQKIIISKSLKEYEELLEPFGFIRTHHSHLINIKRIVRFDKADGGTLILENKQVVPVSQRKREQIMELLNNM